MPREISRVTHLLNSSIAALPASALPLPKATGFETDFTGEVMGFMLVALTDRA
jgi:hypothetical protein